MPSNKKYDCTEDVLDHVKRVGFAITVFMVNLERRMSTHDASKLMPQEKRIFDEYTPKLKELELNSPDYRAALDHMGEALKHHYTHNSHHPEHYGDLGVSGMSLADVVEMVCDWKAAAEKKGNVVDRQMLESQFARFHIGAQLGEIIINTYARDFNLEARASER